MTQMTGERRRCRACGKPIVRWTRDGKLEPVGNFRKRTCCDRKCVAKSRETQTTGSGRRVGQYVVYMTPSGRAYVMTKRVNRPPARRYGELSRCEECDKEFFRPTGASQKRWTNCSKTCGSKRLRRTKRRKNLQKRATKLATLDAWFSLLVRSAGACAHCGSTERLQAAHIVSRRYLGVRFDFDNAVCLCAKCHMYYTHHPLEWDVWVAGRLGDQPYLDLKRRALDFRGPLDRGSILEQLYARAETLDISLKGAPGHSGWTGLREESVA